MIDDDDIDAPENFENQDILEKPSLREIWESNPALKLAAIVLGGAVLLGGYFVFFSKDEETGKSVVRVSELATANQVPGRDEVDPAYRQALEETNQKNAEDAERAGGSAIPLPIAIAKGDRLDVPAMPEKPQTDILAEWRKVADEGRMKAAKEEIEEDSSPVPDVVPVVQPIRPQAQEVKQDPNSVKLLAEQMRVIIAAQAPTGQQALSVTQEDSAYKIQKAAQQSQVFSSTQDGTTINNSAGTTGSAAPGVAEQKAIVPAGSIAYGQLINELNSDIQGPVLVQVLSGPFAGGRAIGRMTVRDEYMVIDFNRIVKDAVSYKVDAIAMDEKTTLAGQATDVDHHYFSRIILPAAAEFVTGFASSVSQTEQTVSSTQGVGTTTENPKPNARENIFKGVEKSAETVSDILGKSKDRPVTVKIAKGTTMGVFFTNSVTTGDAER